MATAPPMITTTAAPPPAPKTISLDVRGLAPPEPMQRVLEAPDNREIWIWRVEDAF